MNPYQIAIINPRDGFYISTTIDFKSAAETANEAVFCFIRKRSEYHDCYIIDPETKAPYTFDTTAFLKGGRFAETGKPYPNDIGACTFTEFLCETEKTRSSAIFHSFTDRPAFCRLHRSRSGRAGEVFMRMSEAFRQARGEDFKNSPFANGSLLRDTNKYFK